MSRFAVRVVAALLLLGLVGVGCVARLRRKPAGA
jgi:hypothetical protein